MGEQKSIQNHLFSVLHEITQSSSHQFIEIIFIVIYMGQLLSSLPLLIDSHSITSSIIFTSTILVFSVIAIVVLIILELLVAIIYRVQVQLYLQLVFYRFAVFPIVLLFLAYQIQNQSFIPTSIAKATYFIVGAFTYFVNFIIHSYTRNSIFRIFEIISNWFIVTDCIIFSIGAFQSFTYILLALLAMVVISMSMRYKLKGYDFSKKELFQYFALNIKDVLVTILLANQLILAQIDSLVLVILAVPLIIFVALVESSRNSKKRRLNGQVFDGKTDLHAFFSFVSLMNKELLKLKNLQDQNLQQSLLLVFISMHKSKCSDQSCLLSQKSTEEQIRNGNSANNCKIIKYKIIKKLQYLFEVYQQTYNESIELKFMLINFYLNHLPNKVKLTLVIASIKTQQLSWDQRLIFFGFNCKVQQLQFVSDLVVDTSKAQDQYGQFKKLMTNAVNCFQQFWGKILQEKVDINQLMIISQKLFPLKKCIEQTWKKHLNSETFSSWSILKAYTHYRKIIMHDYTNSTILEGYCQIIEKRLQSKHEMGYISSQTEQAVITISLTESSLGNVSSLNTQICKMFNFAKKSQMLELRVNDIMPSVFSVVHDGILNSFLKNRFKEINQDQRSVFGKNKNGFIFPMMLQLRKLSWNINDQLIFIAQLQLPKVQSAPIICISDIQGDIQDYTSTFAWLFVKKMKNNSTVKRKNIQQMIPNFFQSIQDLENSCKKIHFSNKIQCIKKDQKMEIQFSASQLIIKTQKVGYLIEGVHAEHFGTFRENKNINQILNKLYEDNKIFTNTFNPFIHNYQFLKNSERKKNTNQFSIPFLQTSAIQKIFQFQDKKKNYAQKIKTCRLFQGRLEHVPQQESFHSDEQNFQTKEFSVIKRIQKLKDQLNLAQKSELGNNFKIAVVIINTLILMLIGITLSRISIFESTELHELQHINSKLNLRQLFSEYLIYTFHPQNNSHERIKMVREELQSNIIDSHIEQSQKQQILQLIFTTQFSNKLSLNPGLLTFDQQQDEIYSGIVMVWEATTVMCFIYVVVLVLIYVIFKFKIANVYSVFISIDQQKLTNIKLQAKKLLQLLTFKNLQNSKLIAIEPFQKEDLGQAQFHRIKKMKNNYSLDDLGNISKLILPAFIILLYSIFCCIFVSIRLDAYKSYLSAWQQSAQLLPSSSIKLMQSFINQQQIGNLSISSNYFSLQKQFQYLVILDISNSNELLPILKGDVCSNQQFYNSIGVNVSHFCINSTVFLQYSFSNLINYMSSMLNNQNGTAINWIELIQIEYDILKPLLRYFSKMLQTEIKELRYGCQRDIAILAVLQICIVVVVWVYILYYPIQDIYEKILFTTDLIKVLPTANQQKYPEQALAAMTTEAMDFS